MADEDFVPVDRDWAVRLLTLIDEQWRTPLTFEERQEWGKALLDLDVDYAVVAFNAVTIASPLQRPSITNFLATYRGVVKEAIDPEPPPTEEAQTLPGASLKDVGLSEIDRIRADTGLQRDMARTERLIGSRGR